MPAAERPSRRVTLSFDNGPDPDVTPHILDLLADRGITAHFFVLGRHLADPERRAIVERARDEGHLIGNHSFSHITPLGEDPRPDSIEREIAATESLLAPIVPDSRRFRPFGGGSLGRHLLSRRAVDYLVAHGYSCVLWNSIPRDWIDPDGWVARALADCAALPHTLMVLHDLPKACLAGLPELLDTLAERDTPIVLDLPPECVPIVDGRIVGDLSPLVAE